MAKIREFIHAEAVFDPEAIQVLASALDDAWDRIQKSGSRFARPAYARAVREVVAKRIIEAAQRGEKDKRGFNFPAHRNLRVSEGVENLLR